MEIVRVGLDLAKNIFEVHGVDTEEKAVLRKTLRRDAVPQFFADLPPCIVGMEACSGPFLHRDLVPFYSAIDTCIRQVPEPEDRMD